MGYHKRKIEKGVLGQPSKVQEELDEYEDAIEQDNSILAVCSYGYREYNGHAWIYGTWLAEPRFSQALMVKR